jgi:transposase
VAESRECPLCGGTMRLRQTESVVHIPGNPRATTQVSREWVCPDCDYFEEADGDGTEGLSGRRS